MPYSIYTTYKKTHTFYQHILFFCILYRRKTIGSHFQEISVLEFLGTGYNKNHKKRGGPIRQMYFAPPTLLSAAGTSMRRQKYVSCLYRSASEYCQNPNPSTSTTSALLPRQHCCHVSKRSQYLTCHVTVAVGVVGAHPPPLGIPDHPQTHVAGNRRTHLLVPLRGEGGSGWGGQVACCLTRTWRAAS